jgi:hypothetical protein
MSEPNGWSGEVRAVRAFVAGVDRERPDRVVQTFGGKGAQ